MDNEEHKKELHIRYYQQNIEKSFFSIKLCTHIIRTKNINKKKQLKIQWTQHLSKSPV